MREMRIQCKMPQKAGYSDVFAIRLHMLSRDAAPFHALKKQGHMSHRGVIKKLKAGDVFAYTLARAV